MPRGHLLNAGEVICSYEELEDGRFQGRVVVAKNILENREALDHRFAESDPTATDALHRAIDYVNEIFPTE